MVEDSDQHKLASVATSELIGNKVWIPISTTLAPRDPTQLKVSQLCSSSLLEYTNIHLVKVEGGTQPGSSRKEAGAALSLPHVVFLHQLCPWALQCIMQREKITGQAWVTGGQKKKWKGNWNSLMHDSCIQLIPTISEDQFEVSDCVIFFLSFFFLGTRMKTCLEWKQTSIQISKTWQVPHTPPNPEKSQIFIN